MKGGWSGVRIDHVETEGLSDSPEIGSGMDLRVFVSLGGLSPEDVDVQVVHGRVKGRTALVDTAVSSLDLSETYEGGRHRFDGHVEPPAPGPSATPSGSCPGTTHSPPPPSWAWSRSRRGAGFPG